MDKKEINEQFDAIDLIINRISKSAKKLITVLASIVTLAIISFYSIQSSANKEREKLDYELRKDFVTMVNDSVRKTNQNEKELRELQNKKLEKKDYIRKIINDEYQKILKKDFHSVNTVAIEQIEEAVNSKIFDDELVMKNASNYIIDKHRSWVFYNKNSK